MRQQTLASFFSKGSKSDAADKSSVKKSQEQSNKKRNMVIDSDEEKIDTQENSGKNKTQLQDSQNIGKQLKKNLNISSQQQQKSQDIVEENSKPEENPESLDSEKIINEEKKQSQPSSAQKINPFSNINNNSSSSKSKSITNTNNNNTKSMATPSSKSQLQQPLIQTQNQSKQQQQEQVRKPTEGLRKPWEKSYKLIEDAPFYKDQDVPFGFLADALEHIQEIKGKDSKGIKTDILSRVFKSIILLNPEQLIPTYYFCILKIAPDYENNELGIGKEIINKFLQKATGRSAKQIRDSFQELGDFGLVAQTSKNSQKTLNSFFTKKIEKPPMTMKHVYESLVKIVYTKGNNSNSIKEGIIVKLLLDSTPTENKFIVRYIEQNLRIAAAEKTMQDGLTKACFEIAYFGDKNNFSFSENQAVKFEHYAQCIRRALCEYPNYTQVIQCLLRIEKDIDELQKECKATPGIPCKPMLAKPTKSIQVILSRFENQKFTCEYKYDGLRGQIHYKNKEVRIFSRNLENMTETYPDIVQLVKQQVGESLEDFILDSEIVAFDTRTNKIRSFQELATRGRKNVSLEEINISVCIFMFDLIYINGVSLLQKSLSERRQQIADNFKVIEGKFQMATSNDSDDVDEIQAFLMESIKVGCEGLMVKTLEEDGSSYEPAKRSFKWLKLKKDYLDSGLGDSFDLVPIGAMLGGGKRKDVYGAYLLASYNEDMECFETICKAGTGFSDEQLVKFHAYFQDKIINNPPSDYKVKDFKADVWFDASVVWEIKGADIQVSPVYTCAQGQADPEKGIGLRFPRLIRIRDDKKPQEATTGNQIYEIYKGQSVVENLEDNDDFY